MGGSYSLTVECYRCGNGFEQTFFDYIEKGERGWEYVRNPGPRLGDQFVCPACEDHLYECSECGQEKDDRDGEPTVLPPSWDSSDGLPFVRCPACDAKLKEDEAVAESQNLKERLEEREAAFIEAIHAVHDAVYDLASGVLKIRDKKYEDAILTATEIQKAVTTMLEKVQLHVLVMRAADLNDIRAEIRRPEGD